MFADIQKELERIIKRVRVELCKKPKGLQWFYSIIPSFSYKGGYVRRKPIEIIFKRLGEVRCELAAYNETTNPLLPCLMDELNEILKLVEESIDQRELTENDAWLIADTLNAFLPTIACDEYLYRCLCMEKCRDKEKMLHWSDCFEEDDLKNFISDYNSEDRCFKTQAFKNQALITIKTLYKERNSISLHERTKAGVRGRYLLYLSPLLFVFVMLLAHAKLFVPDTVLPSPGKMYLVLAGGALGSMISRTIKLRELEKISELKAIWNAFAAQTLTGAALAVMVIIIIKTGLITIGTISSDSQGDDLSVLITVGFLAGFSEPFALGVLEKIAGVAVDNDQGTAPSSSKKSEGKK